MSDTLRGYSSSLVVIGVAIRWFPLGAFADVPSFPSVLTGIVLPGSVRSRFIPRIPPAKKLPDIGGLGDHGTPSRRRARYLVQAGR